MESLNKDLAVINSWCLKWHMRLNIKKTKSVVVSRSRTIAPGYGDLSFDGTELEELKSLRILGVTLDSKLKFETHVREVGSKVARSLGVVRRAGKLLDCPRVLKSCFNAYVLFSLEYCAPVWMSSVESHLGLLDSIVCSAERWCEGELCNLAHRRKIGGLSLLYKIYHTVDHPMNGYLNHFVAARSTRASTALGELALVIPRCRTDQFSRSFVPAAARLTVEFSSVGRV